MGGNVKIDSETIKSNRKKRGKTHNQMAYEADVNVSTIVGIEQGRISDPRGSTYRKIAIWIGVTSDSLMIEV